MKEHECHICGGLVPVLGGEFRPQGRRTVFVCVNCCSDDNSYGPHEDVQGDTKRRKSAKKRSSDGH